MMAQGGKREASRVRVDTNSDFDTDVDQGGSSRVRGIHAVITHGERREESVD
jgi:hypothetical protein